MKKLLLCLVGVLVLTGCGETKTLECSTTQTESGMEMSQKIKANFKDDAVNDLEMVIDVKLDESMKEYVDLFVEQFKTEFDESEDFANADVEVTNTEDVVTVTIKMDENAIKEYSGSEFEVKEDYETTKKQMEEEGYTCK